MSELNTKLGMNMKVQQSSSAAAMASMSSSHSSQRAVEHSSKSSSSSQASKSSHQSELASMSGASRIQRKFDSFDKQLELIGGIIQENTDNFFRNSNDQLANLEMGNQLQNVHSVSEQHSSSSQMVNDNGKISLTNQSSGKQMINDNGQISQSNYDKCAKSIDIPVQFVQSKQAVDAQIEEQMVHSSIMNQMASNLQIDAEARMAAQMNVEKQNEEKMQLEYAQKQMKTESMTTEQRKSQRNMENVKIESEGQSKIEKLIAQKNEIDRQIEEAMSENQSTKILQDTSIPTNFQTEKKMNVEEDKPIITSAVLLSVEDGQIKGLNKGI